MRRVVLIGCSEVTARLPEVLAGHRLELVALGSEASPFRHSRFIDHFVPLAGPFSLEGWTNALLAETCPVDGAADWVIHANDALPHALARAELPLKRRLALLPIRRPQGLAMVGSKAGLAQLLARHGIPTPGTQVVDSPSQLAAALASCHGPLMLKADHGSGGQQVRCVPGAAAVLADPPPLAWYPLLLQAWVAGEDFAVEALFGDGELLGLQASRPLHATGPFGPNLSRRFVAIVPAGVTAALQALGRVAGLHGLFNCGFRMPEDGSAPLLFEADPRPNAWHAFGPSLGLDWGALMAAATPPPRPLQPQGLPVQGRERSISSPAHRSTRCRPSPGPWPGPGSWRARGPGICVCGGTRRSRPGSGRDCEALCVPACATIALGG
ncbi:MAG: hypothetical protein QUV07_00760 [Cyanobium sp. CZS 25K]|nr:hypothetical protein [Cyanobium sp. CZS25K]